MNADVFKSYTHWAYTGNVVVKEDDDNVDLESKGDDIKKNLVRLYVAADLLGDQRLRNAVIDRFIQVQDEDSGYPGCAIINAAYGRTSETSTLRKLFVDYWLNFAHNDWFKENGKGFTKDFLFELVHGRMLNNNAKTAMPSTKNKCKYHEHNEDVPKCTS